jgi:HlyD family secretion protein
MRRFGFYMIVCLALLACGKRTTERAGYVEARLTYLSAPRDGKLVELNVTRGQTVEKGTKLFTLEALPESAAREAARQDAAQAMATLSDLLKGKRPSEREEIRARIDSAEAAISYYQKELERRKNLASKQNIALEQVDQTAFNLNNSIAQLKQAKASLLTATLPSRDDQIEAARAHVKSAEAAFLQADWAYTEKTVYAPDQGLVFDTLYQVGERVSSNRSIIAFLVPRDIYAVFFVPEPDLSTLRLGQRISIHCDSCEDMTAEISYIAPQAEFTPPVIYSQSARSKLVYRVEAKFVNTDLKKLHPGQPIDVVIGK